MWKHVSVASKQKQKQKWTIEKLELDARRLRGICLIDREDKEFKDIMKKARRRLGIPMPAGMLCLSSVCSSRTIGARKTKYACIVEADESMRIRMEGTPRRYHEDHIAEKGMNSIPDSLQSRSQIYSCASSNEDTRCRGSSGDRMGKTREHTGMAADESQKQK